ncbi:MAG: type II toxin-antitoxin system ParD family antitoxin [Pseudomonadales bacterium]|nr:type II toxin-antitoxin system ParD family antitoxin [Pseudomonadales bacterium]
MATMNVSLPDEMKIWVERQAQTGLYSNVSDYVHSLIRHDLQRKDKIAYMQTLFTEGFESGVSEKNISDLLTESRKIAGKS